MTSKRARRVTQQPVGAGDVAGRQHEAVAAFLQRLQQLAQYVSQTRKALERAQLEDFVEQENRGPVEAACAREVRERLVEGVAGARRSVLGTGRGKWRRRADGGEESLGRARRPFDVDVLAVLVSESFD